MGINYDNKTINILMGIIFAIIGILGGCDLICLFGDSHDSIGYIIFSSSIICLSISVIIFKNLSYNRIFDEKGVHFIKHNSIYKSIYWDDYVIAYLFYDHFNRQIIIYLSSIVIEKGVLKKLSIREIDEYGVCPLYFSTFDKESIKFKEIAKFIEQKYIVKFDL